MHKVIRTQSDYQHSQKLLKELLPQAANESAREEIDLLVLLLKDYEERMSAIPHPSPIQAIRFRMEQQGLQQRDLVPLIGSRSKTSEILSGKRPLTLPMIRALNQNLKIPFDSLLNEQSDDSPSIDWGKFPLKELIRRGWIAAGESSESALSTLKDFVSPVVGDSQLNPLFKRTRTVRSGRQMNEYALTAWCAQALAKATKAREVSDYQRESLDQDFLKMLVQLSSDVDGPKEAVKLLARIGVILVIVPHLPQTYLDGAALRTKGGNPVIGLTLRHDRVDNFWFCLLHELGHIALHLSEISEGFFDDLDFETVEGEDKVEDEADHFAQEALVPSIAWSASAASKLRSPKAAESLARKLGVHPAIIAGRIRREFGSFRVLNGLVGQGQVRSHFPEAFSDERKR